MHTTQLILAVLLSMFRPPADVRARLDARQEQIVTQATEAAAAHGIPVGLLLFVGFAETHLGTDRAEGGGWGAPVSPVRRHTAGTADHAARALAHSYLVCHSWRGAVARFRTGLCTAPHRLPGYTPEYAIRVVARMYQRAGVPLPDDFR